jgi:hypothetical protein
MMTFWTRLKYAVTDKARTGVLIVATALALWWLYDVLNGARQFLTMGAAVCTFSAVVAYWTDRCLYKDSRPHTIPFSAELWKFRMFAESRRLIIFIVVTTIVSTWFAPLLQSA